MQVWYDECLSNCWHFKMWKIGLKEQRRVFCMNVRSIQTGFYLVIRYKWRWWNGYCCVLIRVVYLALALHQSMQFICKIYGSGNYFNKVNNELFFHCIFHLIHHLVVQIFWYSLFTWSIDIVDCFEYGNATNMIRNWECISL